MHLHALTLQPGRGASHTVLGSFTGTPRQQEVCLAVGASAVEMLRVDAASGRAVVMGRWDVGGLVRSITPFRLTGSSKDFIVIASDSGRIAILEHSAASDTLVPIHCETFGKSGARRLVPGQYIATDPKGRAIIVAAVERQKFVYVMNRDNRGRLTISSPLEAHKSNVACAAVVGVDVGYENPVFACLEVAYPDPDELTPAGTTAADAIGAKVLTYYELDLGLNHVVRRHAVSVAKSSNLLVALPGSTDGPGGIIICSEGTISYHNHAFPDAPSHTVTLPKRHLTDDTRGMLISSAAVHRMKHAFFVLLQSEEGDLYKLTVDYTPLPGQPDMSSVDALRLKYFDTVPVAAGFCVLKSGFLFVAAEAGNHQVYQFERLGDDEADQEVSSRDAVDAGDAPIRFEPRIYGIPASNISLTDELDSLAPMTRAQVHNFHGDPIPQIVSLCGARERSSLRVLRHGVAAQELAVSDLPGTPKAVWTVKLRRNDPYHTFIVIAFANATLVLSIGESVEEVTDSGLIATATTLAVHQIGDDALLQIYPQGIRHIRADKRISEWRAPANRAIVRCAINQRQCAVALSGGELVYFELDVHGQLNEYQDRLGLSANVTALALGDVPHGRTRSRFLAVACDDNTCRIVSLDPDACLQLASVLAVTAVPESLLMIEMRDRALDEEHPVSLLHVGLVNGILLRIVLDAATGQLRDTRARFLGPRPVRLARIKILGEDAVLAISAPRPWLAYSHLNKYHLSPVLSETLEHGAALVSEACPEGIVAVSKSALRIYALDRFGQAFNDTSFTSLRCTPRGMSYDDGSKRMVVVGADHRAKFVDNSDGMADGDAAENGSGHVHQLLRAPAGTWASAIHLLDPTHGDVQMLQTIELDNNEAAFCVAFVTFITQPRDRFVVVGTAKDMTSMPPGYTNGYLRLYKFAADSQGLELVHKTETGEPPMALLPFQGRILVGVGKALRAYELGKKKLLRKAETRNIPNRIVTLQCQGDRIVIGDIQESVHYASYRVSENKIVVFADDTAPRWITATTMVDYDTIAGGDKFGNLFIVRLPKEISAEVDEDPTGTRVSFERGVLQGAPHKVQTLCNFHLGDIITSIHKTALIAGGRDILVYTTLLGRIGMLVPFVSREDVEFFQTLEMHLRTEMPSLVGRDHLAYRSFYFPVKGVTDGDLCEGFLALSPARKKAIAEELDNRTPAEVAKKLEDLRNLVAF